MNPHNLKPGQKIYILNTGYISKGKEIELKPEIIDKVGNKYFTLKNYPRYKFDNETFQVISKYTAHLYIYLTEQKYKDEEEFNNKWNFCEKYFNWNNNNRPKTSLNKLRRIYDILQEKENETDI